MVDTASSVSGSRALDSISLMELDEDMTLWIVFTWFACAFNHTHAGLLEVDAQQMVLHSQDGRTLRIVAEPQAPELKYLNGCIVRLYGDQRGRRFFVEGWTVDDAGDGSQPYIGPLRYGSRGWFIEDWVTRRNIVISSDAMVGLRPHKDQPILVVGFLDSEQQLRVVNWRALADAETPQGSPP